ncbi:MetQ/NlpA family ABC transporter substrate-binding protein [Plantibacter sp. MPB07]|uniref:MetQ/NlpA family ABC transporter substrate-binding protein n=1 Tax=Plantibacter sp. MPB07 TaxID=3388853 RepID=UPI0039887FA8
MSEHTGPEPSELRASIASGKRKRRNLLIGGVAVVAVAAIAVVVSVVVGGQNGAADAATGSDAPAERLSVKIAVSEDTQFQDAVKEVAAEKGLDVEWVNVKDWVLPNTELVAGTVDANAFQHILYLSAFNAENDADLTPVFSTVITQWGIFSKTLTDVNDLADGARIAIPDDPSNGGRALNILAAAGLIEIAADAGNFPTVEDVTANDKNLQFVPLPATSIPQQFDDPSLAAVVVGTSYFDPSQGITKDDALFLDDSLSEKNLPYVNVIATRAEDKDNPAWKILEDTYADPRVAEALDDEFAGNSILVKVPVKDLRDKLAELQAEAE